jgi:hypothetical protein
MLTESLYVFVSYPSPHIVTLPYPNNRNPLTTLLTNCQITSAKRLTTTVPTTTTTLPGTTSTVTVKSTEHIHRAVRGCPNIGPGAAPKDMIGGSEDAITAKTCKAA